MPCFQIPTKHTASYISELVDRVRSLSSGNPSPAASGSALDHGVFGTQVKTEFIASEIPRYEHHFAEAGNSYRYLGAESCLLKSPRLHTAHEVRGEQDDEELDDWHYTNKHSPEKQ